jgi:Holliday junction resolvasome RuvABC ATP-dependent DNA helicase subunit
MTDTLFKNVIGQEEAKRKLRFWLDKYLVKRMIPNLLVVAPKGQGKTTIARETAKGLYEFDDEAKLVMVPTVKDPKALKPKRKHFIEVNCSTLKNVKQFITWFIQNVQDKYVTVLFDEASEIPHDVSMSLLTFLNPNPANKNTFVAEDGYVCELDFTRQTFIFATSEAQKVFHALEDRLEKVELEPYTQEQLAKIVALGLPDVDCKEDVLLDVASVLRGNARAAQKMAGNINLYLGNRKTLTKKDWKDLTRVLSIYPLGLNPTEIQILRFLAQNNVGTSLTGLSAKTGMSREALQKHSELFLQKHALMEITTTGRVITAKGLEYLKGLTGRQVCPTS